MAELAVLQMPAFKRVYKKLAASHQAVVDDAVRTIVANPEVGEAKKGDLAGVYVHKFPLNRQQMLLAYEPRNGNSATETHGNTRTNNEVHVWIASPGRWCTTAESLP